MQLAMRMWVLGVGFCLALGGAQAASAMSLQDLADGDSFDSGDGKITFSDFSVAVRGGRANTDLSTYEIIVLSDGFKVDLGDATRGMLKLEYVATAEADLNGVSLLLEGDSGRGKARKRVKSGRRPLAMLTVDVGETRFGSFDDVSVVAVKEMVFMRDDGLTAVGNAFSQDGTVSAFALPEPTSLALLAPVTLLALRRRARR